MTPTIHRATPSPQEFAFDHRPSPDETAVYFPSRVVTGTVRLSEHAGQAHWETDKTGPRIIVVFVGLVMAAMLYVVYRFVPEPGWLAHFACAWALVFFFLSWFVWWFNQQATALNPLLVFDPSSRTLRVQGRDEPIASGDVVEIVAWNLSYEQTLALGINRRHEEASDVPTQVSAVVRDGDGFRLVFLYHDRANDHGLDYPLMPSRVRTLAKKLGVPLVKVPGEAAPHDLRPPDRFTKRPEEITRRFNRRQEV